MKTKTFYLNDFKEMTEKSIKEAGIKNVDYFKCEISIVKKYDTEETEKIFYEFFLLQKDGTSYYDSDLTPQKVIGTVILKAMQVIALSEAKLAPAISN